MFYVPLQRTRESSGYDDVAPGGVAVQHRVVVRRHLKRHYHDVTQTWGSKSIIMSDKHARHRNVNIQCNNERKMLDLCWELVRYNNKVLP